MIICEQTAFGLLGLQLPEKLRAGEIHTDIATH
nr:MAG TPA: hypothetical protein [Caudoviricetes sp.]